MIYGSIFVFFQKEDHVMDQKDVPIVHLQMVRDSQVPYGEMKLDTPEKAVEVMRDFLGDMDREYVVVLCLDNCLKPTYIQIAGIGTICASLISVPGIFKTAILSNASGILMFHTHPSGEVIPSRDDIAITRKIREAGNMLDIPLHDHIILGATEHYFSFKSSELWDAA